MDQHMEVIKKQFDEVCGEGIFEEALKEIEAECEREGYSYQSYLEGSLKFAEGVASEFLACAFVWHSCTAKDPYFWKEMCQKLESAGK